MSEAFAIALSIVAFGVGWVFGGVWMFRKLPVHISVNVIKRTGGDHD